MNNLYDFACIGQTAKKPSLSIGGPESQLNQWPGLVAATSRFGPESLSGLNQSTAECSLLDSLLLARSAQMPRATSTSIGHFQPQTLSNFSLRSSPVPGLELSSQLPQATQSGTTAPAFDFLPRSSDLASQIAQLREEVVSGSTLARAPKLSETATLALLRSSLQTRRADRLMESLRTQRGEEIARALTLSSQFVSSARKRAFNSALEQEPKLSTAFNGAVLEHAAPAKKPRLDQAGLGARLLPLRHQQFLSSETSSPVWVPQKPTISMQHKPKLLSMPRDEEALTPYQCEARKQIELFAADTKDVEAKGRNRAIIKGQVGIRCRHCAHLPFFERAKGSTIYPSKLEGIYQAAQNMANAHISKYCQSVPTKTREKLLSSGNKKSSAGGGKEYWSIGAKILNVAENERGLFFIRENSNTLLG